jgi:hypothetical protein
MNYFMTIEEAVFKVMEYASKLDSRINYTEDEGLLGMLCNEVLKITDRDTKRLLRKSIERFDPITRKPLNNARFKKRLFQNENFIRGVDNIKVDPLAYAKRLERIADIYDATLTNPLGVMKENSPEIMMIKSTLRSLLQ